MYRWFKIHEMKMLRGILNRAATDMQKALLSFLLWGVALPCIGFLFFVALGILSQSIASLAEPLFVAALVVCTTSFLLSASIIAHSADLSILLLRSFMVELSDNRKETLKKRLHLLEARYAG